MSQPEYTLFFPENWQRVIDTLDNIPHRLYYKGLTIETMRGPITKRLVADEGRRSLSIPIYTTGNYIDYSRGVLSTTVFCVPEAALSPGVMRDSVLQEPYLSWLRATPGWLIVSI